MTLPRWKVTGKPTVKVKDKRPWESKKKDETLSTVLDHAQLVVSFKNGVIVSCINDGTGRDEQLWEAYILKSPKGCLDSERDNDSNPIGGLDADDLIEHLNRCRLAQRKGLLKRIFNKIIGRA